jgi:dienelactone hydrolase
MTLTHTTSNRFLNRLRHKGLLLLLAALLLTNPVAAADVALDQQTVTFWSEGARLQGTVFKPKAIAADEKLPGILLIHGWGGNRSNLNRLYAPQFARLGFVVMTFDLRSWGDSDGFFLPNAALPTAPETKAVAVSGQHIRSVVNPQKMLEDARAAIAWLVAEPNLQADNIGVWGTSMGGGLALVVAASDPRIKALVTQIGTVNNKANFAMIPDQMVASWETQRARGQITPYPGPAAAMGLPDNPDLIAIKKYDPAAYWPDIAIPTLIIDAEKEELFDRRVNGLALHQSLGDRVPNRYLTIPGTHYDVYRGQGHATGLKAAQDWFVTHLK